MNAESKLVQLYKSIFHLEAYVTHKTIFNLNKFIKNSFPYGFFVICVDRLVSTKSGSAINQCERKQEE